MKLTEAELAREIKDCARYLQEKALRDARHGLTRLTYEDIEAAGLRDSALYDYASLVEEIKSIADKLQAADRKLVSLRQRFVTQLEPFGDVESYITKSGETTSTALAMLSVALNQLEGSRPQNSKAMPQQQAAVRLAHGLVGVSQPRRVIGVSKRIIEAAGLEAPSDRALKHWLKEIRDGEKGQIAG